jgi:hypothetical protein
MRRTATLLFLFAALATAGCGSSPEADEAAVLTPGQIVKQFQTEPEKPRLRKAAGVDPAWEQLGLGLNVSDRLLRRYGVFTIYVVEPGNAKAVKSLLTNKTTGKPLEPDADGIYWELDTQSDDWVAYSKYGDNVVLAWFGGRSEPEADARWERLDRLMSALALR